MPLNVAVDASPHAANTTVVCRVGGCTARATHTPVLLIALVGSEHVSRILLPTHVCAEHRQAFSRYFLSPVRRSGMEAALRSRGRTAPDWTRTRVDFVTA